MFRLGIAVPHIVAGENLDLPVVGNILKGGGGFFIRRTFAGDQLYPVRRCFEDPQRANWTQGSRCPAPKFPL